MSARNITLLVVDDDRLARFATVTFVEAAGFVAITADDGQEAFDLLGQHQDIKMVITDKNMPVMDGVALTKAIRADPVFKSLPVVMVSAEDDDTIPMAAGVSHYLRKPVRPKDLVAVLDRYFP